MLLCPCWRSSAAWGLASDPGDPEGRMEEVRSYWEVGIGLRFIRDIAEVWITGRPPRTSPIGWNSTTSTSWSASDSWSPWKVGPHHRAAARPALMEPGKKI